MSPNSLALAIVVATLLTGCLAPSATQAPAGQVAGEAAADWIDDLSVPIYESVVSSVARVTSEDGTSLSLMLHLPDGLAEGERVPTLLKLTPYQGGPVATPIGYGRKSTPLGTDPPAGSYLEAVLHGVAYVEASLRGTGGSAGCIDFGGEKDRMDARAFVAWIREQPWSNGRVVVEGISHDGMASVVAHVAVPDLDGAMAYAASLSYYKDEWYAGARFERSWNGPVYAATEADPSFFLEPGSILAQVEPCAPQTILLYGQTDGMHGPIWDERDNARLAQQARAPLLMTHGFLDVNVLQNTAQSYWDALPEDVPRLFVWGWFDHDVPNMTTHPIGEYDRLRWRFRDATLFGRDNGMLDMPRVLVEDNTLTWHQGDEWPLEGSERVRLYATGEGALEQEVPAEGAVSYVDRLGAYRGTWTDAHVAFRSEPLDAPRLITGAPRLHLAASSDATETKWVAYLLDEAPDGTRRRISHGYTDSHTYEGEDAWRELVPGTTYNWEMELLSTAYVLEAGHALALLVASSDTSIDPQDPEVSMTSMDPLACWPSPRDACYWPTGILPAATHGRATNTVHAGPQGTSLELAWIDPALTAKPR